MKIKLKREDEFSVKVKNFKELKKELKKIGRVWLLTIETPLDPLPNKHNLYLERFTKKDFVYNDFPIWFNETEEENFVLCWNGEEETRYSIDLESIESYLEDEIENFKTERRATGSYNVYEVEEIYVEVNEKYIILKLEKSN
jgi:hypothetical protein